MDDRAARLDAVALEMGFSFQHEGDLALQDWLPPLRLFRSVESAPAMVVGGGHAAVHARNFMRGEVRGRELVVFDVGSQRQQDALVSALDYVTWLYTVVAVHVAGGGVPDFEIYPEGWLDQGMKDFDFSSHPAFSKLYRLHGKDEAAVRALFPARTLAWYEAHPGLHLEGEGEWIAGYWPNPKKGWFGSPLIAPEDVPSYVSAVLQAASMLVR